MQAFLELHKDRLRPSWERSAPPRRPKPSDAPKPALASQRPVDKYALPERFVGAKGIDMSQYVNVEGRWIHYAFARLHKQPPRRKK